MTELQQGGNTPVTGSRMSVGFSWAIPSGRDVEADASAYLLTAGGKVRGDADMVFYNQPDGAAGAVRFGDRTGPRGGFTVDLAQLPVELERIVFCVTIHEAQAKGQTLALLADAEISVTPAGGGDTIRYRPMLAGATEAAMVLGELYRRGGDRAARGAGAGGGKGFFSLWGLPRQ
nr:TerD family protein [Coxiella burnetii]